MHISFTQVKKEPQETTGLQGRWSNKCQASNRHWWRVLAGWGTCTNKRRECFV